MKYFGTVKSFDNDKGHGMIKPETSGEDLRFDRSAISWGADKPPTAGQRLSYDVGQNSEQKPCAVNLQHI
jgi:cold shock CspA family protein